MKKQMSLFIWAVALFGMSPVFGYTNSGMSGASTADLTGGPAVRTRENVDYTKYQTRTTTKTYESKDGKSLYYTQPAKRSDLYKSYDGASTTANVRTSRMETSRHTAKRKYYMNHPFFQPLKGKFTSMTDLSYNMNSYKFDIPDRVVSDVNGKWNANSFSIQEDILYGITDTISLTVMANFDASNVGFKWNDGTKYKSDDSDLGILGLGARWRFIDTTEWIANATAYYQYQRDMSNNFIAEASAGYKYNRSTIYALGRLMYLDMDGHSYGAGVTDGNKSAVIIYAHEDSALYGEIGFGVFSVLDEDWTLNVEGAFGYYDWHSMATVRAAIGWQPNDWLALNLYLQTSIYDTANDKELNTFLMGPLVNDFENYHYVGDSKIRDFRDTSVGLQAIFYF